MIIPNTVPRRPRRVATEAIVERNTRFFSSIGNSSAVASSTSFWILNTFSKGTLIREEEDLEDDLEDDVEDEEIENLDRVLPPEETTDEAFVEENDELDEN